MTLKARTCAIYNEIEAYPAEWLANLISAGLIAPGEVDPRSIVDVHPDDVRHAAQFHAFAGIGVWSYALRLAGWPDDAPVWSGSCPCQPFSTAGKGRGISDERHLWPVWRELIAECLPPYVFGEQVASPAGRLWLATVQADLEALGYRVDAADLCAAGVGAPHIRQRLFFGAVRLGDADSRLRDGVAKVEGGNVADGAQAGRKEGHSLDADTGPWVDLDWLACRDGKARPTQPGLHPLAHGAAARVGRLRAAGNAIVPQVAATFVIAFMESL